MAWILYERVENKTGIVTHSIESETGLDDKQIKAWAMRGPDYTIRQTDIDKQKQAEIAMKKRIAEYPSLYEMVLAIYKKEMGDSSAVDSVKTAISTVDQKFPDSTLDQKAVTP